MSALRTRSPGTGARVLVAALVLAVLVEPALSAVRGSTLGPCPCGHGGEEVVVEPEPGAAPPCHAHADAEPAADAVDPPRPGEDCIEAYCPHCSADQPRLLVSECGLPGSPSPASMLPSHGPIRADLARAPLPDVVLEILHVPIV